MTEAPNIDLKPCPFCGGKAHQRCGGPGNHYVKCFDCGVSTDDGSQERAVAAWNRRCTTSSLGDRSDDPNIMLVRKIQSLILEFEPKAALECIAEHLSHHRFPEQNETEWRSIAGIPVVVDDTLKTGEIRIVHGEVEPLTYTNWRGETSVRTIQPQYIWFGATEWHPDPQWLLTAFDLEKDAERDFALKDFGAPTP